MTTKTSIALDDAAQERAERLTRFYGRAGCFSSVVRRALHLLDRHIDIIEDDPGAVTIERARFAEYIHAPGRGRHSHGEARS